MLLLSFSLQVYIQWMFPQIHVQTLTQRGGSVQSISKHQKVPRMSVYFLLCYCQFPDRLCRYSMKASKMICIHSCLNISVGFSEGGVSCLQACLSPCTWPIHTQSCRGSLGPAFSSSVGQTPLLPLTVSYNDSHSGTKGPSSPAGHCTAQAGLERPA